MEPFDTWQQDPEFIELPLSEKAKVYLNYFDQEMTDDEFDSLPSSEQRRIKTNFLHDQGVDLGGVPVKEKGFIEKHIVEPYIEPFRRKPAETQMQGLMPKEEPEETKLIAPEKPYQILKDKVLTDVKESLESPEKEVSPFKKPDTWGGKRKPHGVTGTWEAEPEKAEFTIGRLGQQAMRGAAQGFADILRFIKAAEEQRDIEKEMKLPKGIMPTPQERFHMTEWIRKQEKEPTAKQIKAERVRYRKEMQQLRIGKLKKGIEAFPKELPKTSGIIEDAVKGMARFLPSMGVSVVSPIGGAAITFSQIVGMEYDEMISQGIDKERAFDAAVVSSLMQTPVEMAGNLLQIGVLKNLAKTFKVSGKISTKVIQFFEAMGKGTLAEGTEELIQQYPAEFSKIWAANPDLTPKELSEEFVNQVSQITKRGVEAAKAGAVGGALLAGTTGGAIQIPLEISEYVSEKQKKLTEKKEAEPKFPEEEGPPEFVFPEEKETPRVIKREELKPEDIEDIQAGKAVLEEAPKKPEVTPPKKEVEKPAEKEEGIEIPETPKKPPSEAEIKPTVEEKEEVEGKVRPKVDRPPQPKAIKGSEIIDQYYDSKNNIVYTLQKKGEKWGIFSHSRVTNKAYKTYGNQIDSIERTGMTEAVAKDKWKQYKPTPKAKEPWAKKALKKRPLAQQIKAKGSEQNYLVPWIARSGGIKETELAGEIRDIIYTVDARGKKKLMKGVTPGFLNKKGRGLDEIVRDAREAGFDVKDTDHLLELIERDLGAKTPQERITRLTDTSFEDKLWEDAIKEAEANGISEREIKESLEREVTEEIAREAEFAKAEREAIQAESNSFFKEEVSFKPEEFEPAKKPTPIPDIKHSKLMPYTKRGDLANQILMDKNGVVYEGRGEEHIEILKHFKLKPDDIQKAGMINMHGNYVWKGVEGRIEDYRRLWKDALAMRERGEPEVLKEYPKPSKEKKIRDFEKETTTPSAMAIAESGRRKREEAIPLRNIQVPEGTERNNILETISHRLELPIRVGRFRTKRGKVKIGGIYKPQAKVVRIKKANDVEYALHEVGHHIQKLLGFPDKMPEEVMNLAYKGAKNKSQEGFAEFVRFYVTDQGKAQKEAPNFYRVFEKRLARYTDVQDTLVQARQAWEEWIASPSVAKLSSFIVEGNDRKQLPTMNELYTWIVDEIRALQVLKNKVEKRTGVALRASEDPYLLATLTRGWPRKADQYLIWQPFQLKEDKGVVFQGESLYDIIARIEREGKRRMLSIYLVAKRAINDPRILKGFEGIFSKKDFEQAVKELEPEFKETAEKLYEYSDNLLEFFVDSGRISRELADKIKEKNLFYAPLYRLMDGEASLKSLSRTKYANLFNPIKRLKSSSRYIHDPIENLMYNTYAMINIAERNRVGEALIKISKMEGMGDVIEQLPFPLKPIKIKSEEALRAIAKDQGLDLNTFIAEFGLDKIDLDQVLLTFRPNYNPQKGEVIFYEQGEPKLFILDKDLYAAVLSLNKESLNTLTQIASVPAKWLRAGATRFSPEFAIRNPARDQLTAFLYTKYGLMPGYDFLKGAFHITATSKDWQEFNASGAAHATMVSVDRNYMGKNLKQLMRKGVKNIPHMVKHPLEAIQIVSELFEEGTRMGEFLKGKKAEAKKVKKGEQTELDALLQRAYAARDITLDFQRIGLKTRAMNSITAFFNAQIQGVDKMIREFKNHPTRTIIKMWFGITLPSLLLYWAQKDDPIYQEIPEWRRIAFWNIVTYPDGRPEKITTKDYQGKFKGKKGFRWEMNIGNKRVHIWSIPKPFEPGILFGSVPELALDWHYSKDPEGFKETLKALVESTTPSFLPTILTGPVEWFANRMLFFDRPIVPRGKEELVPELQYTGYTSETIKLLAEEMAKVPGLREFASPAKIENLIRAYTGGAGRIVLEGIDEMIERLGIIDVPPEPSMTISDIPGIRAFSGRFPTANTRSIENFYKRYTKLKRKWESTKERAGLRGYGIEVSKPQRLIEDEAIAKALSVKRKVIKQIYKNEHLNPEEKRKLLNDNYWDMINLARFALGKSLIARSSNKTMQKAVNE